MKIVYHRQDFSNHQVSFIGCKQKDCTTTLDFENMTFVIYPESFAIFDEIYSISRAKIALLKSDKTPTIVFLEYFHFGDFLFTKLVAELLKHMKINNYAMNFGNSKELLYGIAYSLKFVELGICKMYPKTNLANSFIRAYKFFAGTLIFFVRKPDCNVYICVHYRGFNNRILKNKYILLQNNLV